MLTFNTERGYNYFAFKIEYRICKVPASGVGCFDELILARKAGILQLIFFARRRCLRLKTVAEVYRFVRR